MQRMIYAIRFRSIRVPQSPALIFTPPLPTPTSNLSRKVSAVRFKQVTTSAHSKDPETEEKKNMDKEQNTPPEKSGDVRSHSFGEGYESRCDDEGFGGIYRGNQFVAKPEQGQLIHENHPAFDHSQGSEVKEKEKARHQTSASH